MTQAVVQVRNIVARSGFANPLTLDVIVSTASYVKVYADNVQLVSGDDYVITGIGDAEGVEIEIIGADDVDTYVGIETFTALFDPPYDQQGDLSSGGVLGRSFESALDQQNRRLQALGDRVDRALKVPHFVDGDIILPHGRNAVVMWNPAGTGFLSAPVVTDDDGNIDGVVVTPILGVAVEAFGAQSDGVTDDTEAVQAAVDYVMARGGGEVYISGTADTIISATIHAGSNVHFRGAAQLAGLRQLTSNIPIIAFDQAVGGQVSRFSIKRLELSYATQQTAADTAAVAIYLGGAGTVVSRFVIEDVEVYGAYNGVLLPNIVGSTGFLGRFVSCNFVQCADYGFSWLGYTSLGATNIELRNVWVTNTADEEIAGSKGFQIARMQGLSMDNCGCDHVQGSPFFFTTVRGWIGTLWAESCDLAAAASSVKFLEASGSRLDISYFYAVSNTIELTGTADCYLIYANTTSYLSIGTLEDNINVLSDSSSGAYYSANVDSTSYIENNSFRYTAHGSTPVPNANLADFHSPKRIRTWDGWARRGLPVTKTADFTVGEEENLVVDKAASPCAVTLPSAASYPGRSITIKTIQAQTVVSASANVVPLAGGAAGTAILSATAGRWARLASNGTSWVIMEGVV